MTEAGWSTKLGLLCFQPFTDDYQHRFGRVTMQIGSIEQDPRVRMDTPAMQTQGRDSMLRHLTKEIAGAL